jgi:hypothetical protein
VPEDHLTAHARMKASDLMHNTTLTANVVVTDVRLYKVRMAVAVWLFRRAADLLGCNIEVTHMRNPFKGRRP